MRKQTMILGQEFGAEYTGKYVFSEITWAKRSRIIQKHTKYHPISGQVQNSDFIAIQAETIWAALREQPQNNPLSLEKLLGEENGVPIALGELFSQIVNGLCALGREETAFLSEPLGAKSPIPQSPISDCAKSSGGPQINLTSSQPEESTSSQLSSTK
jgi:hypothetical protein